MMVSQMSSTRKPHQSHLMFFAISCDSFPISSRKQVETLSKSPSDSPESESQIALPDSAPEDHAGRDSVSARLHSVCDDRQYVHAVSREVRMRGTTLTGVFGAVFDGRWAGLAHGLDCVTVILWLLLQWISKARCTHRVSDIAA